MSTSSASFSKLARNGSHSSTSSNSAIDHSSHNHILNHMRSSPTPLSWIHECWSAQSLRHERIATGAMTIGLGVMTREMMEMHIIQAPNIRGVLDCIPVADRANLSFTGWRKKAWTWPSLKQEELRSRQFAV